MAAQLLLAGKRITRRFLREMKRRLSKETPPAPLFQFTPAELSLFQSSLQRTRNAYYLEYGPGTSTEVAAPLVRRVVSIEHDPKFAAKVRPRLARNVDLIVAKPDQAWRGLGQFRPRDWNSLSLQEHDLRDGSFAQFRSYVCAPPPRAYDCVLIDGRARVHCAQHLALKGLVAPKGVVMIHDFERHWYSAVFLWYDLVDRADRLVVLRPKDRPPEVA